MFDGRIRNFQSIIFVFARRRGCDIVGRGNEILMFNCFGEKIADIKQFEIISKISEVQETVEEGSWGRYERR